MKTIRRFAGHALISLALFVSTAGLAQTAEPVGPRWACWYQASDLTLSCLLSRIPSDDLAARAREVAEKITQPLAGLVQTIWGRPQQLAGKRISIPLWNAPYEMDFARQLAEAVMCGRRDDCAVDFDHNDDGRAALRIAAAAGNASEDEVLAELATQGMQLAVVDAAPAVELPERRSSRRRRAISG